MHVDTVIKHILAGDALLFAGAGFSVDSKSKFNTNLPVGRQLIDSLSKKLDLTDALDGVSELDAAVDIAIDSTNQITVFEFLISELTAESIEGWQYDVADLPWRRVYTTNFDDVLQKTRPNSKILTFQSDLKILDGGETVYLNGALHRTEPKNFTHKLRLNISSYLNIKNHSNRLFQQFQDDLDQARCIVIVGYSLYDDDIKNLIYQTESIQSKTIFVCGNCPPALARRISNFGSNTALAGNEFAQKIAEYQPAPSKDINLPDFVREIRDDRATYPDPVVDDLSTLFLYGKLKPDLMSLQAQRDQVKYYIPRNHPTINAGEFTIIHSHIGNGKTVFVWSLPYLVPERRWYLASANTTAKNLKKFATSLDQNDGLLLDGLDIKEIVTVSEMTLECCVIACVRTTTYEQFRTRLGIINDKRKHVTDFNALNKQEIIHFCNLVEKYSLWPDKFYFNNQGAQYDKVAKYCKSEISFLLLWLFESPQIVAKIKELKDDFVSLTYEEKRFLFAEGFLEVISYAHHDSTIFRLLNFIPNRANTEDKYLFAKLGEFSKFRSPVLAKYFFKNKVGDNQISNFMYDCACACDNMKYDWNECWTLFRRFMRYYNIANFIEDKKVILNLYKRFQGLSIANRDPLFWLQYSISRIEDDDFDLSRRAIEKSKSLVQERRKNGKVFDSYQLDTHEAQFLLKAVSRRKISMGPVDAFTEATKLLNGVMARRPDDTLHVSQTTNLFHEFLDAWNNEFTEGDRSYIRARLLQFKKSLSRVEDQIGEDVNIFRADANCNDCLKRLGLA